MAGIWRPRGPEYHRATYEQKAQFDAGVSPRYWDVCLKDFVDRFAQFQRPSMQIVTDAAQQEKLRHLLTEPGLQLAGTICAGSSPTNDLANAFGALIVRGCIEHGVKVETVDLGDEIVWYDSSDAPHVLVIRGLDVDSTKDTCDLARRMLYRADGLLSVLLVGGGEPSAFCENKLHVRADSYFYMLGEYRKVRHV